MAKETNEPFAEFAPAYTAAGYQPRPVMPGSKACKVQGWQRPDDEISEDERARWLSQFGDYGIGLLLGSHFPDGTLLGALDIDHDDYVRVATVLLGGPPCGRFGSKGIAYFVRVKGSGKYQQFKVEPVDGSKPIVVGELLCSKRLCVIPPTIHPKTMEPYRWDGRSLLKTPYTELPIIEV